jgi:hypothetical protein
MDGFHVGRAKPFTCAARGEICGITRDPERSQAVCARDREDEAGGPFREMATPPSHVHAVADVSLVKPEIIRFANAKVNVSHGHDRSTHA